MNYLTIARIALLLVAWWLPSLVHAQWTNQPSGFTTILDCNFSSGASPCGIEDVYNSGVPMSDGSALVSPPGVIFDTLSAGQSEGGMELHYYTSTVREMYMGMMWKTNASFNCLNLADKMWFIRGPGTVGFFGMNCTIGDTTANILFSHNSPIIDNSHTCALDLGLACFPNVNGFRFPLGSWVKLESYVKASTTPTSRDGIVRWWVNGTLVGNYTNMNYGEQGLNEWIWTETWGQIPAGSRTTRDNHHYIDHLRIATGSGGGGNPPPPVDTTPPSRATGLAVTQLN